MQVGGLLQVNIKQAASLDAVPSCLHPQRWECTFIHPLERAGGFRKAEIDEKDAFKRWYKHLIEADGSSGIRQWRIKEHIEQFSRDVHSS
jgi:hypothetical protein